MRISKRDAKTMGILPGAVGLRINPYAPFKSKWEQEYSLHLAATALDRSGFDRWYERVSFCLVPKSATQKGVWYVPDFTIWFQGQLCEVHEVKGYWRPGAKHKVKALAQMIRPVPVFVVRKEGGEFVKERF